MQKFSISLTIALLVGYLFSFFILEPGSESNLEELKTTLHDENSHTNVQTLKSEDIVYAVKVPLRGWEDVIKPYVYFTLNTESSKDISSHLTVPKENNEFQGLNNLIGFKKEKAYYDFITPKININSESNVLALAILHSADLYLLPVSDLCPFARARSPGYTIRYLTSKSSSYG